MLLTRARLLAYDRLLAKAESDASTRYRELMALWLETYPDATDAEADAAALEIALNLLPEYGLAAAVFADDLCLELAGQEGVRGRTALDYEPDPDAVAEGIGSVDHGPTFVHASSDAVADEVHRAANDQMARSGEALGASMFALVPMTDSKTCMTCVGRAARGFYRPAKGAASLAKTHEHCRCKVVPAFGDHPEVEGHDPSTFQEAYDLGRRLLADGYSHAQARRAMAGEPVGSLGAPNSGVGGRPEKAYSVRTLGKGLFPEDRETIKADEERIGKEIRTLWGKAKTSAEAYRDVFARYVEGLSSKGAITIEDFTKPEAKELQIAAWLSEAGMTVDLRNSNDPKRSDSGNTSDAYLDGVLCDFKRVTSGNSRKIGQRVKEHLDRQGPDFVVDISCSSISRTEAESCAGELLNRSEVGRIYILVDGGLEVIERKK